jgi:hypothetical protein
MESYQIVVEFCVGAFQEDEYEFGCYWSALYLNNFLYKVLTPCSPIELHQRFRGRMFV